MTREFYYLIFGLSLHLPNRYICLLKENIRQHTFVISITAHERNSLHIHTFST